MIRILILSFLLINFCCSAAPVFKRIADDSTPVPGRPLTFSDFNEPSLHAGNCVFTGWSGNQQIGVYTGDGIAPLARVVDNITLIPGSSETFNVFHLQYQWPDFFDDGSILFQGMSSGAGGTFRWNSGQLHQLSPMTSWVPWTSSPMHVLSPAPFEGQSILLNGWTGFDWSICTSSTLGLTKILASGIPLPGLPSGFTVITGPVFQNNGKWLFQGTSAGEDGIYSYDGNNITCVVSENTPLPDLSGDTFYLGYPIGFTSAGPVILTGRDQLFIKTGTDYLLVSEDCNSASISNNRIAYVKSTQLHDILYVFDNGVSTQIYSTATQLDGRTYRGVQLSFSAFDGEQIAFYVHDGSGDTGAVYMVSLSGQSSVLDWNLHN